MADLTVGGALAAVIKSSNLVAGRVFEEGKKAKLGEKVTLPYVTYLDPIGDAPELEGDCSTMAEGRLLSVDLWQRTADEDAELYRGLKAAINGASLNAGAKKSEQHVYQCRVRGGNRVDEPEPGIVHHSITVRVVCGL